MNVQSSKKSRARAGERPAAAARSRAVAPPASSKAPEPAGSTLRPAHLFLFGALAAASAGAVAVRGTSPANVVFVSLAIFAASAASYALYRTLWPLVAEETEAGPEMVGGQTRAALEREKLLALRAIKDLEFDRAMGKVSEPDFLEMSARLRGRAIRLIRQLDSGTEGYRDLIEKELDARLGSAAGGVAGPGEAGVETGAAAATVLEDETPEEAAGEELVPASAASLVCPACQAANDNDARFCKQCGNRLPALT